MIKMVIFIVWVDVYVCGSMYVWVHVADAQGDDGNGFEFGVRGVQGMLRVPYVGVGPVWMHVDACGCVWVRVPGAYACVCVQMHVCGVRVSREGCCMVHEIRRARQQPVLLGMRGY